MIIDAGTRVSNAQAVTASAASTDFIDFSVIRNVGTGMPQLFWVVQVTTAMTDSGSDSTVAVTVETDDNTGFSSATTSQTLGTFAALSAVGTALVVPVAPAGLNERYAQLRYTVAGGNLSTGSFTAFITPDPQLWTAYAKGYTGPTFA